MKTVTKHALLRDSGASSVRMTRVLHWSLFLIPTLGNHRFSVYYGQEFSRLSRDQAVLFHPEEKVFLEPLVSFISLGNSTSYSKRLDDLFVDRLVYVDQWQPFMSKCLQEWKDAVLFVRFHYSSKKASTD